LQIVELFCFDKGIAVFKTKDLEETAHFLKNLAMRFPKEKAIMAYQPKKKVEPKEIKLDMLLRIPLLGQKRANELLKTCNNSFEKLIYLLKSGQLEEKFGKKLIERLNQVFLS